MPRRDQRGIALPITLFIVTLLTITLAAAFARVAADREIAVGADKSVSALTVAQSGLQKYLAYRTTWPPDGDSVRFYVTGGYADVIARMVRKPDTTQIVYVVRSTGNVIVPALGALTQGKRTVAQFVTWGATPMRRIAAYVAANGASDRPGGQIAINGADSCGTIGVGSVRGSTGSNLSRSVYAPNAVVAGSPGWVADTTHVDWTSIINGAFTPDVRYAGNYTFTTADASYASRMVNGNATINNVIGTGLLIVTGNLTTMGTRAGWRGIVLVGGYLSLTPGTESHFYGLVISGLGGPPYTNTQLGGPGGGKYLFTYASCEVNRALLDVGGLVSIPNAWVDNWASY